MPKSFIAALGLIACSIASTAFAQSSDYSDGTGGGEAPTLVMPGLLTNPITSGLDSDGYGGTGTTEQTGTTALSRSSQAPEYIDWLPPPLAPVMPMCSPSTSGRVSK